MLDLVLRTQPPSSDEPGGGGRRPPAAPPRPPFRIMKGKARGAALGFEVIDAAGRKFLLKPDVAGHRGMASAAEVVGGRIFHAAGYNVPGSFVAGREPGDRSHAGSGAPPSFSTRWSGARSPRTRLREQLAGRARPGRPDSRGGRQLAAGQDRGRVRHDRPAGRRSQRPDPARAAPLAAREPPPVRLARGPGRRRPQHARQLRRGRRPALRPPLLHRLRRGPGLSTTRAKGPQQGRRAHRRGGAEPGGAGRAGLLSAAVPGQRESWSRLWRAPEIGWFTAEDFDPDETVRGRKVPAHAG